MLTTIEGVYKRGNVELSEKPAGLIEARVLVTFLPDVDSVLKPARLYGAWKDKIPPTVDVEETLREIRSGSSSSLGSGE